MASTADFAELHCRSHFSFLTAASAPAELVETAAAQGYQALALCDECSLAGIVQAHLAAKEQAIKLIVGTELTLHDGPRVLLIAPDREAYAEVSGLITVARRQASKGHYRLDRVDFSTHSLDHCLAIWLPEPDSPPADGFWLAERLPGRTWLGAGLFVDGCDAARLQAMQALSGLTGLHPVACNDVRMHRRDRKPLLDVMTAIRLGRPLSDLGFELFGNGERHLRSRSLLARLYPRPWLTESLAIAERCRFSLDSLRYEYPKELVPDGHSPTTWLRSLTERGMARRWPEGAPASVQRQVEHELALIAEMAYEPFFLTVHDLVEFARGEGILCQGRGSAANSAVCFALGITEVDPARMDLLFERFISRERNEPPDIDVDFEHERREEVIQYIYRKYGRERAALAASLVTYRTRSAVRDVGKALGLEPVWLDRLVAELQRYDEPALNDDRLREAGFDPSSPVLQRLFTMAGQLRGTPRHLSQHVGGFVIAADALSRLVPVENAAMPERTVIQWDKTDLEALGLLKVDVLALGMLTAIRKALVLVGLPSLAAIPAEDPAVYDMLAQADSVGVFQVESRAQMSMLPRLKPANFYDLVIQIAIVRPGPIQGEMVHPYLARRAGREPVTYPSPAVQSVLERTLGVPIFQEQVMRIAMVAAGFTPGEADELRRAMAAWHRRGGLEKFEQKLLAGMRARGYEETFAVQIFNQIKGFGEYGFPESHSASFALLAYASAWLKRHHPAAFVCALLNSQPMGFYGPSQLIQDVRRHGVDVRPVDVCESDYDCSLEPVAESSGGWALRLGLRMVKGLSESAARALLAARDRLPFKTPDDLARLAGLERRELEALAAADAFAGLSGHRHRAFWDVAGIERESPLFAGIRAEEPPALLPKPTEAGSIRADYAALGLSLRRHPLALLRDRLSQAGIRSAEQILDCRSGTIARTAGLVICRQRPGTASGVTFVTLEDETGQLNLIVWRKIAEADRRALLQSTLLLVGGEVQREDGVTHLIARKLVDLSAWLDGLEIRSRDFQ